MSRKLFAKLLFLITLLLFTDSFLSASPQTKILKINLVAWDNGVGLTTDCAILKEVLEGMGHKTRFFNILQNEPIPKADINIFIEQMRIEWLARATKNWFIPNPEWYKDPTSYLSFFDLILCRTKENERIFKKIGSKTYYTGFASFDKYDPSVTKNYAKCLHLAGAATQKIPAM